MTQTIPITITVEIDGRIYEELADSILEDSGIDAELLNIEWETVRDRVRDLPEFQSMVQTELARRLSDWDPDWCDWIDWTEITERVLESQDPVWQWLTELVETSQDLREQLEIQTALAREAAEADQRQVQDQLNQHLIDQLKGQGYVVYRNPRRRV